MKKIALQSLLLLFVFTAISLVYTQSRIKSVPPTLVKDTLSSSQLSYFARLDTGVTVNDTTIKVALGTANPSNDTRNLFSGDVVAIGRSGGTGVNLYTVSDIGNTAQFSIGIGISNVNAYAGNMIVATRTAIHTVQFTPQTTIAGGAWQFLIKATSRSGEISNDGIPDQEGFDLGGDSTDFGSTGPGTALKVADITCPFGIVSASIGTTTTIVNGSEYHTITCTLAGGVNNAIGDSASFTIGRSLDLGSQLINPAPAVGHNYAAQGTADLYTFFVRHLDASGNLIPEDTATGRIAIVESVRVTATVDPSITFSVGTSGAVTGASICGNTLGSNQGNVTSTAVPFGSISLGTFNDLSQTLSCVTNAAGGYAVTVYEDKAMSKIGDTSVTIADTNCDAGSCTYTSEAAWQTDTSQSSFGYSIHNVNADSTPFTYTTGGASFASRPFGVGPAQATTIMSNTDTPTSSESIHMCYRIVASTNQQAGNYENKITYTATATF